MNILESIVAMGNCGAAGYYIANHNYEIAAVTGSLGVAIVLEDVFFNYINRREQEKQQRLDNEWEMLKLRQQYGGI